MDRKGFTLIEIAIVLVIIGLLLGLGVALIGPLTKQAQFKRSRERVRACKEAIIGFVAARGKLPTTSEFRTICYENDAWAQQLQYIVDDSTIDNHQGNNTDFTSPNKVCCSSLPSDMGLVDNSSGSPQEKKDVAFIVYSKGENHRDDLRGTQTTWTIDNTSYITYILQEYSDNFDDIVEYATIYELRDTIQCEPLQVVNTGLPQATEDYSYSARITAKGSCVDNTTTFSLVSGSLPPGLVLSSNGTLSGTVDVCSGCPSGTLNNCSSTYTFTVQATDSTGTTDNATFTIQTVPQPLTILTSSLPNAYIGTSYPPTTVQATGGKNTGSYSPGFSFSGLPGGLTGTPGGTISGTPSNTDTCGTYSVVTSLNDGCSTTTRTLSLYLDKVKVSCSLTATDNGDNTSTLTYTVFNGFGQADGTFSPSTGTCTGFTNSDSGTCTTGTITTPTTILLTVTDHCGYVNTCQTTVSPSGGGGGGGGSCSTPMSLSPAPGTTFNATVGTAFSQGITVSGGQSPYTNTTCTNNCSGYGLNLSCNTTGATISGTPTTSGTCTFTVGWQDSCSPANSVSGTYTVDIASGGGGDSCTGSHGDTVCDPSNPAVAGTNGTVGVTYPADKIHYDNKNLYLSILCETGTCSGHTFDSFTLTCGGGCGALGTNFKGIHYSIEEPIGSSDWDSNKDLKAYNSNKDNTCGNQGCPLPITTPKTLNDNNAPIQLKPGQRLAVELKFKNNVNPGTYTLTLTFYQGATPFVYQFNVTVP